MYLKMLKFDPHIIRNASYSLRVILYNYEYIYKANINTFKGFNW